MEILGRFLGNLLGTIGFLMGVGGILGALYGGVAILKFLYFGLQLTPEDEQMLWIGVIGIGAFVCSYPLCYIGLWLTDDEFLR